MLKKYKDYIKESLLDNMIGPTKEELEKESLKRYKNNPFKLLDVACRYDLPKYVEYALKMGAIFPSRDGKYDKKLNDLIENNCLTIIPILAKYGITFTDVPPLEILEQLYDANKDCVLSILDNMPPDIAMIRSLELSSLDGVKNALNNGADIHNILDFPLRQAFSDNNIEIVKYLLDNGADIHAKNDYCLRYSVGSGDIELTKILLDYGATVSYHMIRTTKTNKELNSLLLKYYKKTNESLLDKLEGPSMEELWKHYGYDRTFDTAEEFFNYITSNLEEKKFANKMNSLYLTKDGKILFEIEYNVKRVCVEYNDVWKIIEDMFNMEFMEISNLIEKYFFKKYSLGVQYEYYFYNSDLGSKWWFNEKNHWNYKKTNESLLDKLEGPSEEDVWKTFGFDKSFETPDGLLEYLIDNMKCDNNEGGLWRNYYLDNIEVFRITRSKYYCVICNALNKVLNIFDLTEYEKLKLIKKHLLENELLVYNGTVDL